MTVREYVEQVNLMLGTEELADRRIVNTVSVGQDFGEGHELSVVFFCLNQGPGVHPNAEKEVCIADTRCEE